MTIDTVEPAPEALRQLCDFKDERNDPADIAAFAAMDEAIEHGSFRNKKVITAANVCLGCPSITVCRADAGKWLEGGAITTLDFGESSIFMLGGIVLREVEGKRMHMDILSKHKLPIPKPLKEKKFGFPPKASPVKASNAKWLASLGATSVLREAKVDELRLTPQCILSILTTNAGNEMTLPELKKAYEKILRENVSSEQFAGIMSNAWTSLTGHDAVLKERLKFRYIGSGAEKEVLFRWQSENQIPKEDVDDIFA